MILIQTEIGTLDTIFQLNICTASQANNARVNREQRVTFGVIDVDIEEVDIISCPNVG
jgi:hypothetical protein